jgi:hypothetical protein
VFEARTIHDPFAAPFASFESSPAAGWALIACGDDFVDGTSSGSPDASKPASALIYVSIDHE